MRHGRNYKLVGRRKQLFLEALAARGNVTAAAHAAGVSRACAYLTRQSDDAFAKAWEEAEEIAADRLEAEAWRRVKSSGGRCRSHALRISSFSRPTAARAWSPSRLALLSDSSSASRSATARSRSSIARSR